MLQFGFQLHLGSGGNAGGCGASCILSPGHPSSLFHICKNSRVDNPSHHGSVTRSALKQGSISEIRHAKLAMKLNKELEVLCQKRMLHPCLAIQSGARDLPWLSTASNNGSCLGLQPPMLVAD